MDLLEAYLQYEKLAMINEDWYRSENEPLGNDVFMTDPDPSFDWSRIPHKTIAKYDYKLSPTCRTFVSLDTEFSCNKGNERFICQLAAVKVVDGEIIDEKNWMIFPPNGKIDPYCTKVHKITIDDVEGCPTFDEVYNDFLNFVGDVPLVFHNASADLLALARTCNYYNLDFCGDNDIIDTYKLFPYNLKVCCKHLGIELKSHHNAMDDARATAEILIEYLKGNSINPDDVEDVIAEKKQKVRDYFGGGHQRIESKFKKQRNLEEIENPDNFFFNKKIVITGVFDSIERNEIAKRVQELGGKVNGSISGKTDYVIAGSGAGPSKMEKIRELQKNGSSIRVINEDELMRILNSTNE